MLINILTEYDVASITTKQTTLCSQCVVWYPPKTFLITQHSQQVHDNYDNILKDKSSAPPKVKMYIKTSSGWISFKFLHRMYLYVYNELTKLHVLSMDNFAINRHNITHFCHFRFKVSKPLLTHGC